jgi:hypothetical protein
MCASNHHRAPHLQGFKTPFAWPVNGIVLLSFDGKKKAEDVLSLWRKQAQPVAAAGSSGVDQAAASSRRRTISAQSRAGGQGNCCAICAHRAGRAATAIL